MTPLDALLAVLAIAWGVPAVAMGVPALLRWRSAR